MSNPTQLTRELLAAASLPAEAADHAQLTGSDPVLPSSFHVGAAAQSTLAAAALAACEVGHLRGQPRQVVSVDLQHAAWECLTWFSVDGVTPHLWDAYSGVYPAADGFVRVHANFAHHRDGALRLLGFDPGRGLPPRAEVEAAMRAWRAVDFETAAAEHGLVATAARRFSEWDVTPQAQAVAAQPLFTLRRIGEAAPMPLPPLVLDERPLTGVRVLDLTRILAGPVGTRALAAYGADVMTVNSPHLPNISAIAETGRGKRSCHADLRTAAGCEALWHLVRGAQVFVQGYRPGGLGALDFAPEQLAERRPGIVCVSLTAYGTQGPWAGRKGFDSLAQTAMGFNWAEADAAGVQVPKPLPMQILDHAAGHLIALGASAALHRQQREGGSWLVEVSLAQTAHWLRGLGRVARGFDVPAFKPSAESFGDLLQTTASGFGELRALAHSAQLERTPARWVRPSVPPGTHAPVWE